MGRAVVDCFVGAFVGALVEAFVGALVGAFVVGLAALQEQKQPHAFLKSACPQ